MRNLPDDDGFSIESHCIVKCIYRKLFLQHVFARIDECDTAADVANILVAIRWVAKALLAVKETTICKCFRKAGILDSILNVVFVIWMTKTLY